MKKTVKKTKKPEILVNAYDVKTANDIRENVTYAKVRAGKAITEDELDDAILNEILKVAEATADIMVTACAIAPCFFTKKKTPWYKRFWNWLTRKK